MRVSGLTSGMDIDSIVKNLMTAQREPVNRLYQKKQQIDWKREAYREINSKLVDFRNNKLLTGAYSFNTKKADVTGDTGAISAQATSNSNGVAMEVKVTSLAVGTSITSKEKIKDGISLHTTLENLNADPDANFDLLVDGKKIELTGKDTIKSAIAKINNSGANVKATFDEATGKFTLSSKEVGLTKGKADFSGGFLAAVKLDAASDPVKKEAANAVVSINGETLDNIESNKFTINGVTITLNRATRADEASDINIVNDTDKAIDTIKSFIKDYNALIDLMNTKVSEKVYRDFLPLSDEQKKDMKENEITLWENKAKSGMLSRDSILQNTVLRMRSAVTTPVNGVPLSTLGITTGNWMDGGKLTIEDEDKLRQILDEDPDKVIAVFASSSSDTSSNGVISRLTDSLASSLDELSKKAGTSKYSTDLNVNFLENSIIGRELRELNSRISTSEKRMVSLETSYYAKFQRMETAINQLNAQSTQIANFGG